LAAMKGANGTGETAETAAPAKKEVSA